MLTYWVNEDESGTADSRWDSNATPINSHESRWGTGGDDDGIQAETFIESWDASSISTMSSLSQSIMSTQNNEWGKVDNRWAP